MSVPSVFVDTNVLLYSLDERDLRKRDIARKLIDELCRDGNGHISLQVINEFASNLIRKFGRTPSEVSEMCAELSSLRVVVGSMAQVQEALRIMSTASISYWDACVVSTAAMSGCRTILTEDLPAKQLIAGVRIVNPFA